MKMEDSLQVLITKLVDRWQMEPEIVLRHLALRGGLAVIDDLLNTGSVAKLFDSEIATLTFRDKLET